MALAPRPVEGEKARLLCVPCPGVPELQQCLLPEDACGQGQLGAVLRAQPGSQPHPPTISPLGKRRWLTASSRRSLKSLRSKGDVTLKQSQSWKHTCPHRACSREPLNPSVLPTCSLAPISLPCSSLPSCFRALSAPGTVSHSRDGWGQWTNTG